MSPKGEINMFHFLKNNLELNDENWFKKLTLDSVFTLNGLKIYCIGMNKTTAYTYIPPVKTSKSTIVYTHSRQP